MSTREQHRGTLSIAEERPGCCTLLLCSWGVFLMPACYWLSSCARWRTDVASSMGAVK